MDEGSLVDDFFDNHSTTNIEKIIELFEIFFHKAQRDNTFFLATSQNNEPNGRIVLLKNYAPKGFTFFTNKQSQKGGELFANKNVCACFYWASIGVQVRIKGVVQHCTEQESDQYFNTRSTESQIGAVVSQQSRPLQSRKIFVEQYKTFVKNFVKALPLLQQKSSNNTLQNIQEGEDVSQAPQGGVITRPSHWGGYCIVPHYIEFWHDRPHRLHDRTTFTFNPALNPALNSMAQNWTIAKIYP